MLINYIPHPASYLLCFAIKLLDEGEGFVLLYIYVALSKIVAWSMIWAARYSGNANNIYNWSTCFLAQTTCEVNRITSCRLKLAYYSNTKMYTSYMTQGDLLDCLLITPATEQLSDQRRTKPFLNFTP